MSKTLNPEQRARVDALVDGLLDLPPERRQQTMVGWQREEDPAVVEEVASLLRAAEASSRDAAQSHRFVDVLLEIAVQGMLEQSRIAVVVLGRDDDQAIRSKHRLRKCRVLDGLASVHGRQRKRAHVDQRCRDILALVKLLEHDASHVLTQATLARRTENDGD